MQNEKSDRKSFLLQCAITFVIIELSALLVHSFTSLKLPNGVWILPAVYLLICVLVHRILTRSALKSPHRFIMGVNLSVLIKLLSSATICAIYFALKLPEKIIFTIAVLANYIIYTIVLMRVLLRSVTHG